MMTLPKEGDKEELGSREKQIGTLGLAYLLSTEWMNTNILQQSIGSCIQYPVIIHNGKEYRKDYIYICACMYVYIMDSLCCTAEINITL